MASDNGKVAKIAGVVIGGVALLWIGGVSTAVIRAEVREARLCAVETMVSKMQTSVENLASIRDTMQKQIEALDTLLGRMDEKASDSH